MPRISYSSDVDALLVELSDKPVDHAEEVDNTIVHYTKSGEPVLIEILDARRFLLQLLETVLSVRS